MTGTHNHPDNRPMTLPGDVGSPDHTTRRQS